MGIHVALYSKFSFREIRVEITFNTKLLTVTPTKRSDAQPLVEREKQFECRPVEISRS